MAINYIREKELLLTFSEFSFCTVPASLTPQLSPPSTCLAYTAFFVVIKLTPLNAFGIYFVILMHLRVVCILCGTISFSSKKAAIKMTTYFRIHGVLEFREYSTHIFMYTLVVYMHIYI